MRAAIRLANDVLSDTKAEDAATMPPETVAQLATALTVSAVPGDRVPSRNLLFPARKKTFFLIPRQEARQEGGPSDFLRSLVQYFERCTYRNDCWKADVHSFTISVHEKAVVSHNGAS